MYMYLINHIVTMHAAINTSSLNILLKCFYGDPDHLSEDQNYWDPCPIYLQTVHYSCNDHVQ